MSRAGILAVAAAGVLLGAYWARNRRAIKRHEAIITGVLKLQKQASTNIVQAATEAGIPGPPDMVVPPSSFTQFSGLEFAYVIEKRTDGDYVHHIVGKHSSSRDGGKLSEAMLAIMNRLVQLFSPAGLDYEIMLHVECAPAGSQHIDFMLTSDQHHALMSSV